TGNSANIVQDLTRIEQPPGIFSYGSSPIGAVLGGIGQLLTRSDTGAAYVNTGGATSTWTQLLQSSGNLGFNFGLGTSTPFAKLAIHANAGETNSLLFQIASSTTSATTSLFKI